MSKFEINIGEKTYEMEFTRDSARKFEELGGSIKNIQEQLYLTVDRLMFVGLITHNKNITQNLSQKITDEAIDEYGVTEIFSALSEQFVNAIMPNEEAAGENPTTKKPFIVPKKSK